jgi:hypothetical protein
MNRPFAIDRTRKPFAQVYSADAPHRTALQVIAKLLEIQKVDEGQSLLVLPAVLTHSV